MNSSFHIFVYGTLKSGYANHIHFCADSVAIKPAFTYGRLYHLPYGFPAIICQPSLILSHGSLDLRSDLELQENTILSDNAVAKPETGYQRVIGEVIRFHDPIHSLPPIDRLEGFTPGGANLYNRVLVPVKVDGLWRPIWAYEYARTPNGTYLPSGKWTKTDNSD